MAAVQEAISLSGLFKFFKEDTNVFSKGEFKINNGFVVEVDFNGIEVSASVQALLKDRSYKVGLIVDGEGNITSASCECPRGNWLCSHMAAAGIHVHKKGFSMSNLPNTLTGFPPQKQQESEIKPLSEIFKHPKPGYRAISRPVTQEDRDFLLAQLVEKNIDCGLRWILSQRSKNMDET